MSLFPKCCPPLARKPMIIPYCNSVKSFPLPRDSRKRTVYCQAIGRFTYPPHQPSSRAIRHGLYAADGTSSRSCPGRHCLYEPTMTKNSLANESAQGRVFARKNSAEETSDWFRLNIRPVRNADTMTPYQGTAYRLTYNLTYMNTLALPGDSNPKPPAPQSSVAHQRTAPREVDPIVDSSQYVAQEAYIWPELCATLRCGVVAAMMVAPTRRHGFDSRRRLSFSLVADAPVVAGLSGVVVELLASYQGEPGSIPGGVTPGLSHAGIVQDDARQLAGFLGDLPFPQLLHSGAAPYSHHFTLIGSQDLVYGINDVITSRTAVTTYLTTSSTRTRRRDVRKLERGTCDPRATLRATRALIEKKKKKERERDGDGDGAEGKEAEGMMKGRRVR
ncbi:hypothetical protein PR048_011610 [Dryococelus australis]|uniref:Capsid protein n=1 Tax=Dryococelus australis TaxID=614101 RepID=A0ABQ9HND4_9NEOP|nr:hypothetical protein PR048_011610 [Dryococelus australis]